jgi:molybdate transport system ATP-binding protein
MLQARLTRTVGLFRMDVAVAAEAGTTMVLAGESGAGKTTLLRLLAGLAEPDPGPGQITVDGEVWWDGASGRGVRAARRDVGVVFQDYALFPHLSALENAAFGLRAAGVGARDARRRAAVQLDRLGLAGVTDQRPRDLSGGQQQRVALARALVLESRLLLLDEPLAALDLQTRREVRGLLRDALAERPGVTVYVTHSPLEAIAFGHRIAVMERGRITQEGEPGDLLMRPRTPYVAEFMGMNFFRGPVSNRHGGVVTVDTAAGPIVVSDPGGDGEVMVAVSPREITLFAAPPAGSAQNLFPGRITELVPEPPAGDRVRVSLATRPPLVAEVTRQAVEGLGLHEGLEVYATFKAVGVQAYR